MRRPTRVSVRPGEAHLTDLLAARCAELGYTVLVRQWSWGEHPYLQVGGDDRDADFTMEVAVSDTLLSRGFTVHIQSADGQDVRVCCPGPRVAPPDLCIEFALYCWGTWRGGRLPYDTPVEVTPERLARWNISARIRECG